MLLAGSKQYGKLRFLVSCDWCFDIHERPASQVMWNNHYCGHSCRYADRTDRARRRHAAGLIPWYVTPDGYCYANSPAHPMASPSGKLSRAWHEYHLACPGEAKALRKMGASMHHKNGDRQDDTFSNLEPRLPGQHPTGVSVQDMIDTLQTLGYRVEQEEE